jgi:hypothetical protein
MNLSYQLNNNEERHFREFFRYVIFFSMIYYIVIMLIILAMGYVVPRKIMKTLPRDDEAKLDRRHLAVNSKHVYRQRINPWKRYTMN